MTGQPNLTMLIVDNNNLTQINLTNNSLLTRVYINNNNLSSLDLSNQTNLQQVNLSNNPSLTCVQVSQNDIAGNSWTMDNTTNKSLNCNPQTYNINVTASSASDYTLSGSDRNGTVSGSDPSVTIKVGDTINFAVSASGHPFYLKTVQGTGTSDLVSGVTNNGATNGTVSWTPTAAGTYYYQCSLHNGMYGTITVN